MVLKFRQLHKLALQPVLRHSARSMPSDFFIQNEVHVAEKMAKT
jgi:hypothetical protein